jgi:TrmH family RNA methyltransferase
MEYRTSRNRDEAALEHPFPAAITSVRNSWIQEIRRALRHGEVTSSGLLAVEGTTLIEEAARSGLVVRAVLSPARPVLNGEWVQVPDHILAAAASTETAPKAIGLVEPPPARPWREGVSVYLDAVQDPGNAGAIARSAEAFGAAGIIFGPGTVSPLNPKVLRASAGSLFRLPFSRMALSMTGPVYRAEAHEGCPPWAADWSGPCVLVIGSEAHGVSQDLRSRSQPVRIPTSGVESLNAAIAASILLYECARQRGSL